MGSEMCIRDRGCKMQKIEYRLVKIKGGKSKIIGEITPYVDHSNGDVHVKWQAKTEYSSNPADDLSPEDAVDYVAEYWTEDILKD